MSNHFVSCALIAASFSALALGGCDRKGVDFSAGRSTPDPRIVKNFAASEPEFCSFDIVYSETTGAGSTAREAVVKTRYVVVGQTKDEMLSAFAATCAASAAAPKTQCEKYRSNQGKYQCVAASLFAVDPETTGVWSCTLPFTANDKNEVIAISEKSTATEAISAAFTECAALTDSAATTPATTSTDEWTSAEVFTADAGDPTVAPSGTPSPAPSVTPTPIPSPTPPPIYVQVSKRRDACAAAMLAEKMTCQNTNDLPPVAPPAPPKRRLFRVRRH